MEYQELKIDVGQPEFIHHEFDGLALKYSNYWETAQGKGGVVYLTGNAGGLIFLLPHYAEKWISDIRSGEYVILSIGRHPMLGHETHEILFEDKSESPCIFTIQRDAVEYSIHGSMLAKPFRVYRKGEHGPELVLETQCYVRNVKSLPYMKPWGE